MNYKKRDSPCESLFLFENSSDHNQHMTGRGKAQAILGWMNFQVT